MSKHAKAVLWLVFSLVCLAGVLFCANAAKKTLDHLVAEAEKRGMRECMKELDDEYQKCPKCWCPVAGKLRELEEVFADVPYDLDDLAARVEKAKRASHRVRDAFGDTILGMREEDQP